MKKTSKIVTILLIAFILISTVMPVFAATSAADPSQYTGANAKVKTTKIDDLGQNIVKVVSTIGSVISVIVLVVLGIKYMMGSAEEKAEYKKTLLPYIIGAALVFAASTVASMIFNFASSI